MQLDRTVRQESEPKKNGSGTDPFYCFKLYLVIIIWGKTLYVHIAKMIHSQQLSDKVALEKSSFCLV